MSSIHVSPGSYLKNTSRILNVDANAIYLVNQQISSINDSIYGYQPTYGQLTSHTIEERANGLCAAVREFIGSTTDLSDQISVLREHVDRVEGDVIDLTDDLRDLKVDVDTRFEKLEEVIPEAATSANQLADKQWTTEEIKKNAATFISSFATYDALSSITNWQTTDPEADYYVTNNDYAVVLSDETHDNECWRYVYTCSISGWLPQYMVNERPFTETEMSALESGATKEKIDSIADKAEKSELSNYIPTSISGDFALKTDILVPSVSSVNGLTGDVVISAENISSGVFDADRIPQLAIFKIENLQEELDSKVSAISMNDGDPITATNGVVDLGTVLTAHQSLSDYVTEQWVSSQISSIDLTEYVKRADLSMAIVSALSVGTGENGYNYTTAGTDYTPTTISAAIDWSRKLHQAFINVLNLIAPPTPPEPPTPQRETTLYFDDGTSESYSWTGEISQQTMIDAGLFDEGDWIWTKTIVEAEIGTDVTSIGDSTFQSCVGLTSITIPDSVTSIEFHAFEGCSGLTSMTISNGVTNIGDGAFEGCSSLISVTIPDFVTSIGNSAFYGCSGLASVTIPDSVTSIGYFAFSSCIGLTSITIPDGVTSIGEDAFFYCTSLTALIFEGKTLATVQEMENYSWGVDPSIISVAN